VAGKDHTTAGCRGYFYRRYSLCITQIVFGETGAGRRNVIGHQVGNAKAHRAFRVMHHQGETLRFRRWIVPHQRRGNILACAVRITAGITRVFFSISALSPKAGDCSWKMSVALADTAYNKMELHMAHRSV
jgi:hypothetical protein